MRNPYHEYKDYDEILFKINQIQYAMKKRSSIIPYQKDIANTDIQAVYRRGDCSYNCSKGKGDFNGKPFPTAEYLGEYDTYQKREKAKYKKDGSLRKRTRFNPLYDTDKKEWIYTCYSPVLSPLTDDIQILYEICKEYRQVSSGKNHRERQVIVADVDEDFTSDTISILESICNEKNIPHFTYLEHHLDSNHYQFGWVLDSPFIVLNGYNKQTPEYRQYLNLIKKVAYVFNSDPNYKGWWMKNPNGVNNTETFWFNDTVSKESLVSSLDLCFEESENDTEEPVVVQTTRDAVETRKDIKSGKMSRNDYLLNNLRSWIWDYMKATGQIPPYSLVRAEGNKIADEAGIISGKGKQNESEIEATVKAVYGWSKKQFVKLETNKIDFNIWVVRAKRELCEMNAYEIFLKHFENGEDVNRRAVKRKIIEEIMAANNETARSARNHLNTVLNAGGVSNRYADTLLGHLLFCETKGKKVDEYKALCNEVNSKFNTLMKEFIEEEIFHESLDAEPQWLGYEE